MEFIDITIGEWMDKMAAEHPDQPAVIYTDKFEYRRTYREFNDEIHMIAKAFLALGIKRGDHVAIWATNYPQWMLTLYACAKIGAVLVTVNTAYKIHEAEYLLKQSDTKMLVMCDGFKDVSYIEIINSLCPEIAAEGKTAEHSCKRLPMLKTIITIDEDSYPGMYNWNELPALAAGISDEEYAAARRGISCHDTVNMQYTSGTTGFPKGVMLSHYNILNNGKTIGDCMKFSTKDKLCITVPFFHCFGLVLGQMACITHATTMVPVNYYSPVKVMEACQKEKCTALHGVPTMFIAILEHPRFKEFKFNLRTGIMAGSPCPIKVMRQVIDEMGMREITITYGQTEASPGCTQTTTDDSIERRVNTVGRAFPGVETKIIDPVTGETLGPGKVGEFCARGYNVMKGYYKMPEATAQAIDKDGWLHTGDLATVDADGYYKITGRIKDMIIRGGENIYPKEIEDFIYTHPKVRDVQVVGVPSKVYGEEVMAFVIPKEGVSITEDEIKEYVRASMAKHKVPAYVTFIDTFPMNAAGKILKYKLREMAIEAKNLQDAASIETA
jgi:fatty-acyl-CoA synthase